MKSIYLLTFCMALILSCENRKEEPLLSPLTSGEISGARLWERITIESSYSDYKEWPGHEGLRPGQSPHGNWHRVYANRDLTEALPLSEGTAPYGTIIVKENYSPGRELDKLTVMAKVEGYSPESNDWFWAMISSEGDILAEGSPGGCISCHSGMKDNDYIIIKDLKEPLD